MGDFLDHYTSCRKILRQTAKRRNTITYSALASALGLRSPRQRWSALLNPIAKAEVQDTGRDLTLVAVYSSGVAKGLSRYFSNLRGGHAPQATLLDPRDHKRVAAYRRELESVFDAYAK